MLREEPSASARLAVAQERINRALGDTVERGLIAFGITIDVPPYSNLYVLSGLA